MKQPNPGAWSLVQTATLAGKMRRATCLNELQLYAEQAKSPWIPESALVVLREAYRQRLGELQEFLNSVDNPPERPYGP